VVAPAVGPVLGGWLVEYVDWRLIFFINVPIGLLGTIAAIIVFPRVKPTSWPKFDMWGFVTVAYGLASCCWPRPRARSGTGARTRS